MVLCALNRTLANCISNHLLSFEQILEIFFYNLFLIFKKMKPISNHVEPCQLLDPL